jgi:hypothetical protein
LKGVPEILDEATRDRPGLSSVPDEVRMPGLMHQSDKVNRVPFNPVADVVGKRAAVLAGESVWADMITAFPSNNGPCRVLDPFMKIITEPVGNRKVTGLGIQQVLLEMR